MKEKIIITIDPGLCATGYSVISFYPGNIELKEFGEIKTKKNEKRLQKIYVSINDILDKYQIESACIENTFVNVNPGTSLSLGAARGISILCLQMKNIPYSELSPSSVRKLILNKGNATKEEVKEFTHQFFDLKVKLSHNIIDALFLAIGYHKIFYANRKEDI